MTRNIFVFICLLLTILLLTGFPAQAQQPPKVPRIGFLSGTFSTNPRRGIPPGVFYCGEGAAALDDRRRFQRDRPDEEDFCRPGWRRGVVQAALESE